MIIRGDEIKVRTRGFSDICDITSQVEVLVADSGITNGLVNIHIIGSTASVSTIEYEPALVKDMQDKLEAFAPKDMPTRHGATWGDDNGFSHLRATMMGPGITVPVSKGEVVLGTWQQIIVIDHDNRPRDCRIFVQVMGV
jgi:secondary thiamine-phosphate synthase enzyme